ncbi:hypothetical protein, partial [Salmonella sp. SAL4450]|uniref:hypothetical protein n=1 Tax=Salmonella sp. SAL4450 TaxID=3159905 RepID=UPI00397CBC2B
MMEESKQISEASKFIKDYVESSADGDALVITNSVRDSGRGGQLADDLRMELSRRLQREKLQFMIQNIQQQGFQNSTTQRLEGTR